MGNLVWSNSPDFTEVKSEHPNISSEQNESSQKTIQGFESNTHGAEIPKLFYEQTANHQASVVCNFHSTDNKKKLSTGIVKINEQPLKINKATQSNRTHANLDPD